MTTHASRVPLTDGVLPAAGRRGRVGRRLTLAAALTALVLMIAACGSDGADSTRTVTVTGTAEVTGTPDTLRAEIGVESSADDVTAALNAANAKIAAITDAVTAQGVERSDIATAQVSIRARDTDPAPGTASTVGGYTASNTLRITMRDLDSASAILAKAVDAGGDDTRLRGVSFAIDDDSELVVAARDAAFANAKASAQQYADLAGDSLGSVQSIDESTEGQSGPSVMRADSLASPVPLEPGEQTLTFTVKVTYSLT